MVGFARRTSLLQDELQGRQREKTNSMSLLSQGANLSTGTFVNRLIQLHKSPTYPLQLEKINVVATELNLYQQALSDKRS